MFRNNLWRTGVFESKGVHQLSDTVWKFKTQGMVQSSPTVDKGVVYFGSCDDSLYALDINTGLEKWRFATERYVFSSPAVFNGAVYFGSNDGHLYALDINTGVEKWRLR